MMNIHSQKNISRKSLIILGGIFVGVTGLYLTYQSNAALPPPKSTKKHIVGLMDRKGVPNAAYREHEGKPLVKNFVVNASWDAIEDKQGVYDFSTIDNQLNTAKGMGSQVRLRIFAGRQAPDWVKEQTGSVSWYEPTVALSPNPYRLPKFWTSDYQKAYTAFLKKFSDLYDGNTAISEVTLSMCGTTFAEPLIRQQAHLNNKKNALAAGYTYLADFACMKNDINLYDHRSGVKTAGHLFPTTRVSFAVNPYQAFDPPAG